MNSYKAIYENEIIKSCEFDCQIGEEDKCLTCDDNKCSSCNIGYKLIDGKCKADYTIKATYHTDKDKKDVLVINYNLLNDIEGMIVNGENVYPSNYIHFPLSGNHTIYFKLKNISYTSFNYLFGGIQYLDSVAFIDELNTEYLKSMESMFSGCSSLTSIDLTKINTKNVENMDNMFYGCYSLTSIDLSNFSFQSIKSTQYMFSSCFLLKYVDLHINRINEINMDYMFSRCNSLISIDLSNFNAESKVSMKYMFYDCNSLIVLIYLISKLKIKLIWIICLSIVIH
jgi:surface protein